MEDDDIAFLLNNFRVIEEVEDVGVPALGIGLLRLVTVPERDDKCSWISRIPNLSSGYTESFCPRDNLYLMLSERWYGEYERFKDQSAHHIGLALFWHFVGLEATEEKRSVVLRLKTAQIVNGKMKRRSVAIEISSRRDGGWSVSRTDSP